MAASSEIPALYVPSSVATTIVPVTAPTVVKSYVPARMLARSAESEGSMCRNAEEKSSPSD